MLVNYPERFAHATQLGSDIIWRSRRDQFYDDQFLLANSSFRLKSKTDFKAVFGRVESRDLVQARARIGGTIVIA